MSEHSNLLEVKKRGSFATWMARAHFTCIVITPLPVRIHSKIVVSSTHYWTKNKIICLLVAEQTARGQNGTSAEDALRIGDILLPACCSTSFFFLFFFLFLICDEAASTGVCSCHFNKKGVFRNNWRAF
ncbi:hypothetical protein CEXT_688781 [Caerostris extrusa]|uniref:Uncharacterized protein n=1 Tax=Caerostris extrusa TaxID=172846 RepID=A0AAV4PS86_CAEEX|nr:hypothetical protein CEXT_688781 [Caerostris extrusa]